MKKKLLKISGIAFLLVVTLLVAIPFFLEAKIGDIIKNNANNNLNATLDFTEAQLSLIKSFPSAEVSLENVVVLNHAPFEGDTLFSAANVELNMGLMQLFKGVGESIAITRLTIDGAQLDIKVNKEGKANYDVAKPAVPTPESDSQEGSEGFSFNMESYAINDAKIGYHDLSSGIKLVLDHLHHTGSGDLSATTSELDTHTQSLVSFSMDSTRYLNAHKVQLDARIGIDLNENKYTFLQNEALINQLPLVFDGFVAIHPEHQEVDITFKTPSSDFKNFLALIPEEYSKNLEGVTTTGNFEVQGAFNGIVDEQHIPKFTIAINSNDASFKYPDLPKAVRNVFIDMEINNTTGITEDTYVTIEKASFTIDRDKFNMTSGITDLLGNTKVRAHLDGKMDLANVSKAYPVPEDMDLKGIFEADITTAFDMQSIEKEDYGNTTTSGTMSLRDFEYTSNEMTQPVQIDVAAMTFDPKQVKVGQFNARTGKTDIKASGIIDNFLGFVFNGEEVKGRFQLQSDTFSVDDFMVEETAEAPEGGDTTDGSETVGKIKIPSFLDCGIDAKAQTVLYDNLVLTNVQGHLKIKDQKAVLRDMTTSLFNGQVRFDGEVSTKEETPTFAMRLGMENLGISESFEAMELFQTIAPVAEVLRGKLDSDIELSGSLTDDLLPNMATLSGNVLAEILAGDLNTQQSKLWNALGAKLDFVKADKLNLKGLKTALSFENGQVRVKPFTIAYEDMEIKVDGSHTFDKKMNYTATLDVPAKYLGKEVNGLMAQIDDSSLEELTIPVTASIGGVYNKPSVTTDLTSGVKTLTQQLIEIQKQKMVDKGTEKAKDLLKDVLGGKKDSSTTETESTEGQVKDVLGGILGGNQKERDSISVPSDSTPKDEPKDVVKEKAKDILGGLFGKKNDTVR